MVDHSPPCYELCSSLSLLCLCLEFSRCFQCIRVVFVIQSDWGQHSWGFQVYVVLFSLKPGRGEEESLTPPTDSSGLQKDLKLKKLVSQAEFKGVQDKSTGKCWCFEQILVVFLDDAHLLALLSISRVFSLLGNVVNTTCLLGLSENVRHYTINNKHKVVCNRDINLLKL